MFKKMTAYLLIALILMIYPCQLEALTGNTTAQGNEAQVSATVVEFSAGRSYCLAVKSDGTLWAWGNNQNGQLGDGTKIGRSMPVQIGTDTDWSKVTAGKTHSLGIKKDGSLWAWGNNVYGQLGDGTTTERLFPVKISNDSFISIAVNANYSLAIRKDGTLWESGDMVRIYWDKTNTEKTKLRRVGDRKWKSISVGELHVLAIDSNGSLWAWGMGGNGQFGNGTDEGSDVPLQIDNSTDWVQISAGAGDSMGLKKDGSLWRWGSDPSNKHILKPVMVGRDTDWISFTNKGFVSAVKSDGSMWTWGYDNGEDGVSEPKNISDAAPRQVGYDKGWNRVDSGYSFAVALKADGTLWSWGQNNDGELGYGQMINNPYPVWIGEDADWKQVSAGDQHTLAIKADGSLWAWGSNISGELGNMRYSRASTAPQRIGNGNNWEKVVSSAYQSFAIASDGTLWGWGGNNVGMIYNSDSTMVNAPYKMGEDSDWVDIGTGSFMAFGLKKNGTIWVWGTDPNSSFFESSKGAITSPEMVGKDNDWVKISYGNGGDAYVLAQKKDGSLWGWGFESYSRIGNVSFDDGHNFLRIGKENDWKDFAAGGAYAAAIKNDGSLWVWDLYDVLFNHKPATAPVRIGNDNDWIKASSYMTHVLLLKNDGSLWGLGYNESGQLGDGTKVNSEMPVPVAGEPGWNYMSAGDGYSMAIRDDGTLWAWGSNDSNQLGFEKPSYQAVPMEITLGRESSLYYNGIAIAYGNGVYVYTRGSNIWFSANCSIWVKLGLNLSARLNSITFNGKAFVAVGDGGSILKSNDGKSWSACSSGSNENLGSVTWGKDTFVAVGEHGTALVSGDAVKWTNAGYKKNILFRKVIFTGDRFIMAGEDLQAGLGIVLESADGKVWSMTPLTPVCALTDIAWDGIKIAGIGTDGSIWVSGLPGWHKVAGYQVPLSNIIWSGSTFIVTGNRAFIVSYDGNSWSERKSEEFGMIQCACAGSPIVAVNNKGYFITSMNGLFWKVSEKPIPEFVQENHSIAISGYMY